MSDPRYVQSNYVMDSNARTPTPRRSQYASPAPRITLTYPPTPARQYATPPSGFPPVSQDAASEEEELLEMKRLYDEQNERRFREIKNLAERDMAMRDLQLHIAKIEAEQNYRLEHYDDIYNAELRRQQQSLLSQGPDQKRQPQRITSLTPSRRASNHDNEVLERQRRLQTYYAQFAKMDVPAQPSRDLSEYSPIPGRNTPTRQAAPIRGSQLRSASIGPDPNRACSWVPADLPAFSRDARMQLHTPAYGQGLGKAYPRHLQASSLAPRSALKPSEYAVSNCDVYSSCRRTPGKPAAPATPARSLSTPRNLDRLPPLSPTPKVVFKPSEYAFASPRTPRGRCSPSFSGPRSAAQRWTPSAGELRTAREKLGAARNATPSPARAPLLEPSPRREQVSNFGALLNTVPPRPAAPTPTPSRRRGLSKRDTNVIAPSIPAQSESEYADEELRVSPAPKRSNSNVRLGTQQLKQQLRQKGQNTVDEFHRNPDLILSRRLSSHNIRPVGSMENVRTAVAGSARFPAQNPQASDNRPVDEGFNGSSRQPSEYFLEGLNNLAPADKKRKQ